MGNHRDDYNDAMNIIDGIHRLSRKYNLWPREHFHHELALAFGIMTINRFNPDDPTEYDQHLEAQSLSGFRYYLEACVNNRIEFYGVTTSKQPKNKEIDFVVIVAFDRALIPEMVLQLPWKDIPRFMKWDPEAELWYAELDHELKAFSRILYKL